MASFNRVFLMGNLTRDPEVRYLPSGQPVAELRMAVNRRYKTAKGEEKEEVCFVNVAAWGRTAETCSQYLSKGSPLFVEGRLRYEEWEKDGQKHNRLGVVAERVQFIGAPRRGAEVSDTAAEGEAGAGMRPAPPAAAAPRNTSPAEEFPPPADEDNLPF
jgi:single-strand DNA-binding protein